VQVEVRRSGPLPPARVPVETNPAPTGGSAPALASTRRAPGTGDTLAPPGAKNRRFQGAGPKSGRAARARRVPSCRCRGQGRGHFRSRALRGRSAPPAGRRKRAQDSKRRSKQGDREAQAQADEESRKRAEQETQRLAKEESSPPAAESQKAGHDRQRSSAVAPHPRKTTIASAPPAPCRPRRPTPGRAKEPRRRNRQRSPSLEALTEEEVFASARSPPSKAQRREKERLRLLEKDGAKIGARRRSVPKLSPCRNLPA